MAVSVVLMCAYLELLLSSTRKKLRIDQLHPHFLTCSTFHYDPCSEPEPEPGVCCLIHTRKARLTNTLVARTGSLRIRKHDYSFLPRGLFV